ncbi:hypothetical protein BU26DRAFT_512417 [Trematosphaeria pertusa]|uniref:Uncharacterized protein n=1 Tax=Trematosphaeria pertusa TaxID=390896 RepID=A0A6A6HQV7_9PLEO|nr:uncharacterized protein BU26DRAFT_512417 [Trematosphaeria pertusa]KAF2240222.1 hypothetical protein BU26DRAFT_512417 [Trematosphaeria pertusa]
MKLTTERQVGGRAPAKRGLMQPSNLTTCQYLPAPPSSNAFAQNMHPIEGHPVDFLAQLDNALQQHPKPKSRLAPYFEAHLLFQGAYRTPSPSPSPSPPPAPSLASATFTSKKRRRAASSSEPNATPRPSKRRRPAEPESTAAAQPVPAATTATIATKLAKTQMGRKFATSSRLLKESRATAIAPKPAATRTPSNRTLRTRKTPAIPLSLSTTRKSVVSTAGSLDTYLRVGNTPASVVVGRYSLRRTAGRIRAYESTGG